MTFPKHNAASWIETRTGLFSLVRQFARKPIPASSGWPQVLGSVALFLFLVQALTGALLALNYSPSPGAAWNSVRYIESQVASGGLIRGLHHWGSSAMIVVVVAHMTQVFLAGAYKRPREVIWIVGVILLIVTLGFGLTGYLLPWDNRGYWGTVVTTQIARNIPGAGPLVANVMGGVHVGAITLSRFFAFHSIVLPVLAVVLIAAHLFLVVRHGVTPAPAEARETIPFYPRQAFKDAIAVFVCFAFLFGAALFVKVPLERMADPTDLSYLPRPEWYFLFLFELLKYFRGAMEPVATAVLPALAVTGLMLAPFLDRFRQKRLLRRILTLSLVLFAFSAWGALTWSASASASTSTSRSASPENVRGAAIYKSNHCDSCHSLRGAGGQVGPALDGVAARRDRVWLHKHFQSPQSVSPDSMMPAYRFSDQEEAALVEYLADRDGIQ